jgi:hypothetical protein
VEQHTNLDVLPDNDLQIMMISAFLSPLFMLFFFRNLGWFLCFSVVVQLLFCCRQQNIVIGIAQIDLLIY